jgi:mannose-6-phosphate isomerase-like protein (cupin superfamily)
MSDYTVVTVDEVPDAVPEEKPGEMRGVARALGGEQLALTHRVLPPGAGAIMGDRSIGHHHRTQEEIYYVISGTLTFKFGDDDPVEIGARSAVLVPPETVRSYANDGDQEAEFLILSTRSEDIRSEAQMQPGFWSEPE